MSGRIPVLALLIGAAGCGSGGESPQKAAVAGTVVDNLSPLIAGYVIMEQPRGGIIAIELPSLRETTARPAAPPNQDYFPFVEAVSGPDEEDRIAYIEDFFNVANEKDQRHLLKTVQLDGKNETVVFSRAGDAMWSKSPAGGGVLGRCLALSPVKGRVATLVSQMARVQMPSALLEMGSLEIWDVVKKAGAKTGTQALDSSLAWFADGKRLAYAKLIQRKDIPKPDLHSEAMFPKWNKVPAVYIRDVDSGAESFLHIGLNPVAAGDGQSVLVTDLSGSWRCVNVATGRSKAVTWHGVTWAGACPGAIAYPAPDVVLSWCLPAKDAVVKYTENNSPLVGRKEMFSLSLAKLNSDKFQTVVPYIDSRTRVSFGRPGRTP